MIVYTQITPIYKILYESRHSLWTNRKLTRMIWVLSYRSFSQLYNLKEPNINTQYINACNLKLIYKGTT